MPVSDNQKESGESNDSSALRARYEAIFKRLGLTASLPDFTRGYRDGDCGFCEVGTKPVGMSVRLNGGPPTHFHRIGDSIWHDETYGKQEPRRA